jgi:hypothetical protein
MDQKTRLQFKLLTPDAQRSAIRRLALSGLDDDEIAGRTGWTAAQVRSVLSPPGLPDFMPWALEKSRRSGSSGGSLRG